MMEFTGPYRELLQRMYDRCVRMGWFGPEMDAPDRRHSNLRNEHIYRGNLAIEEIHREFAYVDDYEYSYIGADEDGEQRTVVRVLSDGRDLHFPYLLATSEQIAQTEAAIGFPLPPLLRDIYMQIGNGGFGYRQGFVGCIDGADSEGLQPIDKGTVHSSWKLSEKVSDGLVESTRVYKCYELPDRFIPWCSLGCASYCWIDGWSGNIYSSGIYPIYEWRTPEEDPDEDIAWAIDKVVKPDAWVWPQFADYFQGQHEDTAESESNDVDVHTIHDEMDDDWCFGIHYEAPSLEAWIEKWLASPLPE